MRYPGSLHNHTEFSNLRLRDCIIKVPELIDYAIELGHEIVGITDHEAVCSAIKIEKKYREVKKSHPNFKVVLGNEIYLCRDGLNLDNFVAGEDKYYHFCLWAKDAIGHKQIRELSTRAWLRSYMGRGLRRVPTYYQDLIDIIGAESGHVIGGSGCLGGLVATQLLKKEPEVDFKVERWVQMMMGLFGKDNFYLELQPSHGKDQIYVNRKLIELSNKLSVPYIITTDSHYLKKEDAPIHEAFLNAQEGEREVSSFYATTYMMGTEELESYLELTKEELEAAYLNILKIKDSCEDYSLMKSLEIPRLSWKIPETKIVEPVWIERMPHLKDFISSSFEGDNLLACSIVDAFKRKPEELQNQQTYEATDTCLEMTWISSETNKAHWSSYFLNLQKIIDACWEAGSLTGAGRGSGVGFILLYLLDITQINPLREKTQTFPWRFLNPVRASCVDVDCDIETARRGQVLDHLREVYGDDRVANVATFRQEKSRSAILTACRGLHVDVDTATYLSGLIASERGITRSLEQTFYGDEESGIAPNYEFVRQMTEVYPEVWEVARKIENLVCGYGIHAGGVIFVDKPFTETCSLMRAPDGTIITAFDLHDAEDVSLIKYDLLSVEALDRIHACLDLLVEQKYVVPEKTLRETYEKVIGIYNLERDNPEMWKMVWNHKVLSLFQMEKQSGISGIELVKPKSVDELAILNSVIRLMAQGKGAEQPLNKFARFKNDVRLWYREMDDYGLTKEEQKLLEPLLLSSYGICESQEKFMSLVQMPECGGFDLSWAEKLRKSIAKKNPEAFEKLQKEYFETVKEKGLSKNLCNYVWNVLVCTSRGYGFNASHTLAYSLIGLQEMNLAYPFPTIFWNCANLICESGGIELSSDDDDDDEESNGKEKGTDYGKIATAIGKITTEGVKVAPPNINRSSLSFYPDVENNQILYGLSGISKIKRDFIIKVLNFRPFTSVPDFVERTGANKLQTVNLIKSGAFDEFGDRRELMEEWAKTVADTKKTLNLRNLQMLIKGGLLPSELDEQIRFFNFTTYLKKLKKGDFYSLDAIAFDAFERYAPVDLLRADDESESGFKVSVKDWDKLWKKVQDVFRNYITKNQKELLEVVNKRAIDEIMQKYASGSISKWEMDSVSYYSHPHELACVDHQKYGFADYTKLPDDPTIERVIKIKGKDVPLFHIERIAGTVLSRDKIKKTVTLLTTTGVVVVKIFGDVFSHYDRQLSEIGPDGTKTVLEKSWFARGNKIIVCGVKRDNCFLAKKYSRTPFHLVELITDIDENGNLTVQSERREVS